MLPFVSLHRMERRLPPGFTLIELLVVIAIISVLAAILSKLGVGTAVRDQLRLCPPPA